MRMNGLSTFLGKMFLRYGKGAFPVVLLAVYTFSQPGREIMGSESVEHLLDFAAIAAVLLGLSFRALEAGGGLQFNGEGSSALAHTGDGFLRSPRYLGGLLICFGIFLMHGGAAVLLVGTLACVLIFACMARAEGAERRGRSAGLHGAPSVQTHDAEDAEGFSVRRAVAADWLVIVSAFVALAATEIHEYLPTAQAAASREALILIVAAAAAFVLVPIVMRVARTEHSGIALAGAQPGPETRGIRVDGRAGKVDFLENMLSFGQQEAILAATLKTAALRPGEFMVDVGCGTGKLVVAAAQGLQSGDAAKTRLLGIDATPGMIELAVTRAHDVGVAADFQVGLAEALPLADGAADAVTSSYFFHHLPSEVKPQVLREMWRVLKPGGRLVITDYGRARGLYGFVLSMPMRANFYEYVRPQLRGELEKIIAAEGLGEPETCAVYLGYITVMRLTKPR